MHDEKTTPMNNTEEFEDLAAAVTLGALSDKEESLTTLIKSGGTELQKDLAELRRVNRALAVAPERPIEPPPAVKDRLLQSLKTSEAITRLPEYAVIKENEGEWQNMAPGVSFKNLFNNPAIGSSTMLMRMAAGSILPSHHHDHIEELYVIEGDCYSAGQRLTAGDYHRAEDDSEHGTTFTEHGCLMIVHTSSPTSKS